MDEKFCKGYVPIKDIPGARVLSVREWLDLKNDPNDRGPVVGLIHAEADALVDLKNVPIRERKSRVKAYLSSSAGGG